MNKNQKLTELMIGLFPLLDRLFVKPMESIARGCVSNTQLRVLFILNSMGKTTMGELARKLEISKQQITSVIDGLVQMDFAERVFNPKDRRKIEIAISPKATEFLKELQEKMVVICNHYYEVLTPEEINTLWNDINEVEGLIQKMLKE